MDDELYLLQDDLEQLRAEVDGIEAVVRPVCAAVPYLREDVDHLIRSVRSITVRLAALEEHLETRLGFEP